MSTFRTLVWRNMKLFFKDKGMFFTSLITPIILLVLYSTFLSNVYRDSFRYAIPDGFPSAEKLIGGMAGGELVSSLLAVCCITVAFCSNMLMVQDKLTGARRDLTMAPVKRSTLAMAYFAATALATLLICLFAAGAGFLYLAHEGWYLSGKDVLYILLDVVLLVLFGTALSSIVNYFLSTQGQISAVGSIVSAGYGFICGAYMPISSFGEGLQKVLSFLPGTYGTSLLRNHVLRGTCAAMSAKGLPQQAMEKIRDGVDCNIYFFGDKVPLSAMYAILCGVIVVCIAVYVLLNALSREKAAD